MNTEVLIELGFTKNEAKIYEALLRTGELSVSAIAAEADINRRNVYDTLNRLTEKGFVFEIRKQRESLYRAVDPKKLSEQVKEKEEKLNSILPGLEKLYKAGGQDDEVFIYRGLEGWKNYMRDILAVGEDLYTIGGRGAWSDPRLENFFEYFAKEAKKNNIWMNILFDHAAREEKELSLLKKYETNHRFLPEGYDTPAAVDIFGDRVVVTTNAGLGEIIDEETSLTVIINQQTADAFRTWFDLLWEASGVLNRRKKKGGGKGKGGATRRV